MPTWCVASLRSIPISEPLKFLSDKNISDTNKTVNQHVKCIAVVFRVFSYLYSLKVEAYSPGIYTWVTWTICLGQWVRSV